MSIKTSKETTRKKKSEDWEVKKPSGFEVENRRVRLL